LLNILQRPKFGTALIYFLAVFAVFAVNIANAIARISIDETTEIRNFFCLSDTSHIMSSKSPPPPPINDIDDDNKSGSGSIKNIYNKTIKKLCVS
jgi:uncharacterized membrane protein